MTWVGAWSIRRRRPFLQFAKRSPGRDGEEYRQVRSAPACCGDNFARSPERVGTLRGHARQSAELANANYLIKVREWTAAKSSKSVASTASSRQRVGAFEDSYLRRGRRQRHSRASSKARPEAARAWGDGR